MQKIKCLRPFTDLMITKTGVYQCCVAWTKYGSLGDIKNESIMDIWNGERFQYVREKMYRNEYGDICNRICPVMLSDSVVDIDKIDPKKDLVSKELLDDLQNGRTKLSAGPTSACLLDSRACNLRCIMCGAGSTYLTEDKEVSRRTMGDLPNILPYLRQLILTGDGDPFFRKETRELLENFNPKTYPQLEFTLLTNGILLTRKMWDKIKHNNIAAIWVSVDAACKETYEKIRLGGKWDILMKNLEMVGELRKCNRIKMFEINMTVMRSNYHEIIDFAKLGKRLNCDQVAYQRLHTYHPPMENVFDPPDPKVFSFIRESLNAPVFKEIKAYTKPIADCTNYTPKFIDALNYRRVHLQLNAKKMFDRYITWRFKQPTNQ